MAWMLLAYYTFYLPYCLRRRSKLNVPRTITATAVVIATAVFFYKSCSGAFRYNVGYRLCSRSDPPGDLPWVHGGHFPGFVGSFMDFDETMF